MVVAAEDDTYVDVYYTDNGVTIEDEHVTLQKYEVFTRDAHYMTEGYLIDFTGTRVMATKPVAVYSGDGFVQIRASVSTRMRQSALPSGWYRNECKTIIGLCPKSCKFGGRA